MSLRYNYKLDVLPQPVVSLGGRYVRPRPVIPVTLIGPANTRLRSALLDTGADDSLFPENLAPVLGVDLSGSPVHHAKGVGMGRIPVRYAEVKLRLTDGIEFREWMGWVGFTPVSLYYPLLGFAGCLQFFTATFHGDREEVELTVNRLYRGT